MDSDIGSDPALVAGVDDFFAAEFGPEVAMGYESTGEFLAAKWQATVSLGLTGVGIDEGRGGSGGSLQGTLAIAMSAGRNAVPLPIVENYLATWLLADAGLDVPSGPLTVVPGDCRDSLTFADGRLTGRAHNIPWARAVEQVVALVHSADGTPAIVSFDTARCTLLAGEDLAGQPGDTVTVDLPVTDVQVTASDQDAVRWRGALLRAAQMAGAMTAIDRMTRRYAAQRVQFGKPISAFQAVQQHMVNVAQAAEISAMSVWGAGRAASLRPATFEICAAKLVANEAARVAVRAGHQVHGAIGMTREYPLHIFTRRLNAWRQEFGTERQLAVALGAGVSASGSFAHVIADSDDGVQVPCPT
jgi:acyl-CoA dehydrogenase